MSEQNFIVTALLFGCIAGLSPGPLMALIISETIKHGKEIGIKIGLVPLITDLPIMAMSIFVLSQLSYFHFILGWISLSGGAVLLYIAYENFTINHIALQRVSASRSLSKVMLTNFLNPGPYVFFFTIGGPIIISGMNQHMYNVVIFIILFFMTFIGINIAIALGIQGFKSFFHSKQYIIALRVVGIILCIFSLSLFHQGFQYFGIIK